MLGPKGRSKGFTLIELLVVVAILTLLVSMLMPMLSRAREIARRVICMQNQKNIAAAVLSFSTAHGGRSPGGGLITVGNNEGVGWDTVMNTEWFRANNTIQCIISSPYNMPRKSSLTCPSFRIYGGWYNSDVYAYNRAIDASGVNPGVSNVWPTADGLAVDPKYVNYIYQQVWPAPGYGFGNYFLGAQFEKIVRPGGVFLLMESEYNGNTTDFDTGWATGSPCQLGVNYPAWTGPNLRASFRHTLTPDPVRYQGQATAVYTYADFHVEIVNPNMPGLLNWPHFVINGRQPGY